MKSQIERLLDIAKRLDEIADDGPSELTTLSDEIGQIAAALEDAPKPTGVRSDPMPKWMEDIRYIVERNAEQIIHEARGKYPYGGRNEQEYERRRMEEDLRRTMSQQYSSAMVQPLDPRGLIKGLGVL